jgi:O-acetyl-ADP-ribose deacetylase (regulator of RNase III)
MEIDKINFMRLMRSVDACVRACVCVCVWGGGLLSSSN